MCNCSGSERSKPSDKEFSTWLSVSVTWGDAGIKSCTSARTGGGEGCLIIFTETGVSVVSKEIREQGSSVQHISVSSFGVVIDSRLDFSGSTSVHSFFITSPLCTGCCRLFFHKNHQIKWIGHPKFFKTIKQPKSSLFMENQIAYASQSHIVFSSKSTNHQ